jgi:hypothetical protein
LSFAESVEQIEATFPRAAGYLGAPQIGALVCCSCLVGMIVPGLHSLFAALDVSFVKGAEPSDTHFAVTWVEPRFRRVRIGIRGGGLQGVLETIVRPPPLSQATMKSVAALVRKDEFRGSTGLIVGGSRGLGELTAKLIAAGGGRVIHVCDRQDRRAGSGGGTVETAHRSAMVCESLQRSKYHRSARAFRRRSITLVCGTRWSRWRARVPEC